MGNKLISIFQSFNVGPQRRILLLGLDAAGKTTITYTMKDDTVVQTIPTVGFNCEEISIPKAKVNFVVWDVGGQEKLRALWKHYYAQASGLFFVVDCADRARLHIAREELYTTLNDPQMKNVPLVVLANKQDVNGAISREELIREFDLNTIQDRKWDVQETCAVQKDGLLEAFTKMASFSKDFVKNHKN